MRLLALRTTELTPHAVTALRRLFDAAWPHGEFDEDDWRHAMGGLHVVVEDGDRFVAHASVVPRTLTVAGVPVRGGYVEAVATDPTLGGRGFGSRVMGTINDTIRSSYELGALSTGVHGFYERLGWLRWRGPTWIRTQEGLVRSAEDDDGLMVLPTPALPDPDLGAAIAAEWRPGDVW